VPQENTIPLFLYSVMVILAVVLLVIPFCRQWRNSSLWVRAVCFVLAINRLIWSALGFALVLYSTHLSSHMRASLFHWKLIFTGIALGLLVSLLFSAEFRQLAAPGIFGTRGLTKR
jgi:hypothetical protein